MTYSKGLRRELMKGRNTARTIRKSMNRQHAARLEAVADETTQAVNTARMAEEMRRAREND